MEHLDRMKVEHSELKQKIEALRMFIHSNPEFKQLEDLEQVRMIKQLGFMESYLEVLGARIWVAK